MKRIIVGLLMILLCGCDDRVAQRQAVVDELKTTDVYDLRQVNGNCACEFVGRDNNGAIWLFNMSTDMDKIKSKTMIFSPVK